MVTRILLGSHGAQSRWGVGAKEGQPEGGIYSTLESTRHLHSTFLL